MLIVSYVCLLRCQVGLYSFKSSSELYVDVTWLGWCRLMLRCLSRTFKQTALLCVAYSCVVN